MSTPTIDELKAKYAKRGLLERATANIEAVRQAYISLDAGDLEGFFRCFSADAVAYEADTLPYGGVYKGLAECRRLFDVMMSTWGKVHWEVQEFTGGGDVVIVMFQAHFTTKKSGKSFSMPVLETWRFRDGKVVELQPFYYDTHYCREALLENGADSYRTGG